MADPSEELDPLGRLADEFLSLHRRGERPSIDEFLGRAPSPDRRDELRDLLSALLTVERVKSGMDDPAPSITEKGFEGERPDRLGDFRILREVGRGGMGVVYEAEQVSLGRKVALKVLAPWLRPGTQQVQRFLREARSAARLHHPDIVPIFGVGEHEGRHFYAMQFISGQGLDRVLDDVRRLRSPAPAPNGDLDEALTRAAALTRLDDGPTPESPTDVRPGTRAGLASPSPQTFSPPSPGRGDVNHSEAPDSRYRRSVAEIVMHVAEALHYAHGQGMLHRDIKPSNLLLDDQGKVWVTDFGLVKADDAEDLTSTGDLVGTLRYMAPERFRGRCDARSDVYSLGLTLYEMLALRPAFVAADRQRLIHEITQEEPEPIRRVAPGLPRDLSTIVQTAIARDPGDRYQSAGRLAEDLRRWLRHEPIQARPSGPAERLAKWARRNPAVAALAATAAAAAAAAVAILAIGLVQVSRALYESQRRSYFQRIALAERSWSGNDVGRTEAMLDESEPEFRSWEWRHLKKRCHADLATLRANAGEQPNAMAFGPGGATAATAGAQGSVILWDVPSGSRIRSISGRPGGIHGLAFSPDGATLAAVGGRRATVDDGEAPPEVRLFEIATGLQTATLPIARGREGLGVAFSPDGVMLVSCSGVFWETVERSDEQGELTLWDVRSGLPIRTLDAHAGSVHQATFSPDGSRLASAGGDGSVRVWDPANGQALHDLRGHEGVVSGVSWRPDGRRAVSSGLDGTLRIWDVETGAAEATFRDPGERFLAVSWSPDGRWIAAAGRSWAVTVWDAETGRKVETYRGHDREVVGVAYSGDGGLLGSAGYDGVVRIWDARKGQDALTMAGFASPVTDVAVDPDGRWLAAASIDRPVELRELDTGRPGPTLQSPAPAHSSAAFSPDGSHLAAAARRAPGLVEVWDAPTGNRLRAIEAGPAAVTAVVYSPDGRTMATGDADGRVRTWDAGTGAPLASFDASPRKPDPSPTARPVTSLAFAPDGRLAAATGNVKGIHIPGRVTVWDLRSSREVLSIRGHTKGVADVVFSPDGRYLATASWDQTAGVWDLRNGERLWKFRIPSLLVWAVAFTPDGARVVSADNIGRMTFWDVESGSEVLTLPAHSDRIYDIDFAADGRLLASAGRDRVVKVWDAIPPTAANPGR